MTPCIKLESYSAIFFFENFWMIFQMFLMYENGRGMFYNFGKIEKYWIWGLLKFEKRIE